MTTHLNLLEDPLISIVEREGNQTARTLPEILHLLATGDRIGTFANLQAHQWPAWYVFLVQLAALAVQVHQVTSWSTLDAAGWKASLRDLTRHWSDDAPWCLVVDDLAQPAFLQPPVPERDLGRFSGPIPAPDATDLDILVTSKGHDVKPARLVGATADAWAYGLVTLQTMSGYSGKKFKHGVIRMNGGYGNRPVCGIATSRSWGSRFRRDLKILLDNCGDIAREHGLATQAGHALLWLTPWDGRTPVRVRDCVPYFIEVARRIRLSREEGPVVAWRRDTDTPRLVPKSDVLKGNVGDPWIPVSTEGTALTLGGAGLTYDRMRALITEDGFRRPECGRIHSSDEGPLLFYVTALVRGMGKTDGCHERWIEVPRRARPALLGGTAAGELQSLAKERVERAADAKKKALVPAVLTLLEGAPAQIDYKRDIQRWRDAYEARVDEVYFPDLWHGLALEPNARRRTWSSRLRDIARAVLEQAEKEAPVPDARRERAVARAWRSLEGALRRRLPEAFEYEEEEHDRSGTTTG